MSRIGLRDRVGEWGPLTFCALLSVSAFYLLILHGASLSKLILLGVVLICPAIYFIAWLLGRNSGGGGRVECIKREEHAMQKPVSWTDHPARLIPGRQYY